MNRSTIMHLADFAAPYRGGFIASLNALNAALSDSGLAQLAVFPDRARARDWFEDWQGPTLPDKGSPYKLARAIAALAASNNVKIIHTHYTRFDIPAYVARRLLGRGRKVEVIWHVRSMPAETGHSSLSRRLKDFVKLGLISKQVHIVAVSEGVAEMLHQRGLRPRERTIVVPNGLDTRRALASTRLREELRALLGISEKSRVLLLFGWEPHRKGVDIATEAVGQLVMEGRDLVLLLVGTDLLEAYVEQMYGTRVPDWLRVVPPQENVADLYRVADVFVAASRAEGFSYAVGEAIVNELPVCLSDIPGHQWAAKMPTAALFRSEAASDCTATLRKVLNWSANDIRSRGSASKDEIEKCFSIDAWCKQMLNIYHDILQRPHPRVAEG